MLPQLQDGCAQRAVLGRELVDIQAALGAEDGVRLRRGLRRMKEFRCLAQGFGGLLGPRLRCLDVFRDCLEDLLHMIAERERGHLPGGWKQGRGESLPSRCDFRHFAQNELSESHSRRVWAAGG